jgi:hypothetical protein
VHAFKEHAAEHRVISKKTPRQNRAQQVLEASRQTHISHASIGPACATHRPTAANSSYGATAGAFNLRRDLPLALGME